MVEDMASKAAQGDEESQLLVTEEEMKELHRQVSEEIYTWYLLTGTNLESDARENSRNHASLEV